MSRVFGGCRALMAAAKAAGTKATMAAPASKATAKITTNALKRPLPVSPAMKEFLGGVPEISRAEAVKKIWEHIKRHELQNPSNKREINCDAKLKALFEDRDKVHMMEIAKMLSLHFIKSG